MSPHSPHVGRRSLLDARSQDCMVIEEAQDAAAVAEQQKRMRPPAIEPVTLLPTTGEVAQDLEGGSVGTRSGASTSSEGVQRISSASSSLFRRLARGKPAAVGQALECREPSVSTKSEGSTPSDEALPNGSDGISPCNRRSACVGEKYQQNYDGADGRPEDKEEICEEYEGGPQDRPPSFIKKMVEAAPDIPAKAASLGGSIVGLGTSCISGSRLPPAETVMVASSGVAHPSIVCPVPFGGIGSADDAGRRP